MGAFTFGDGVLSQQQSHSEPLLIIPSFVLHNFEFPFTI